MLPLLEQVPAVPYADPWQQPLAGRLQQLASRTHRVAYFYEQADNSTFRYRVYNMVQVINAADLPVSAAWFFLADLDRLEEIADLADQLVICRTRYDGQVDRLIHAFRIRGKRVLFDSDDFVFDLDHVHLLIKSLDIDTANPQVWQDWFAYVGRLGATLKRCDGGIATNDYLAGRMQACAGSPVAVVPNFLNPEQLTVSDAVYRAKLAMPCGKDDPIRLGYFSGSPSHNRDFALVLPALEALLEQDERLEVVVVGYIDAGPGLARFGHRVHGYPFQDYVNLQRLIGAVDINLMPLQYNVFTNCKSELKYFDAAVVGTVSIASPSYTYAKAIRHGENGFLSQAHEWETVLRHVIDRLPTLQPLRDTARADALQRYGWQNQIQPVLEVLDLGHLFTA